MNYDIMWLYYKKHNIKELIIIRRYIIKAVGLLLTLSLMTGFFACSPDSSDKTGQQPSTEESHSKSTTNETILPTESESVVVPTTEPSQAATTAPVETPTTAPTKPAAPDISASPDFPSLPAVTVTAADVATFSGVNYYISDNIIPYVAYKTLYPELSTEDVITRVNIGLHTPFYSGVKTISNPSDMLVLCNKYNTLGANYEPSDMITMSTKYAAGGQRMRKEAAEAFYRLSAAANKEGHTIIAASTYRSYTYQNTLYNRYVSTKGQAAADLSSARAGTSEHQTGLAVDVATGGTTQELANFNQFGKTAAYQWAKDNIHKYGFIIRYPEGKTHITGYKAEPWHFRYVGTETATAVYESGLTYDEYYVRYIAQ